MTTHHTVKDEVETHADKVDTHCPQCKRGLRVPRRETQFRSKCPACHTSFIVHPAKKAGDDTVAGWVLEDLDEAEHERMEVIPLPSPVEHAPKSVPKLSERIAPLASPETSKEKLLRLLGRQKPEAIPSGPTPVQPTAAPAANPVVNRAGWRADSYPQDVFPVGVAPHLAVKECTPAGVRFRFDSVWLEHPGFRVSMPLRCFASGHHLADELYARPMVFCDQSGGQVRSPQDVTVGVGLHMTHQTPREVEAQLAKVEHMPTPFDNPVPYYATMTCGDFYMECTTHKRPDGWTCEVLIPDLETALQWLANVNGVTGPDYHLLQKDAAAAHSESWVSLHLSVRLRLAFWIGFKPDERFLRYFNDASCLASDMGLAGLAFTSHRMIHRHRFTTSEVDVTDPGITLVIRVKDGTPLLYLKKGAESSCVAKLRDDDVNDIVDLISSATSFKLELADI